MASTSRKFYKIYGINTVFELKNGYYDLSILKNTLDGKIDEHSILFIIAEQSDVDNKIKINNANPQGSTETSYEIEHVIKVCDTFIWARGAAYCISTKGINGVTCENNVIKFTFSDGSKKTITISTTGTYKQGNNISIDVDTISATGYSQTYNLFKILDNKTLYAIDVHGGSNINHPDYKLSDIHSVISSDWYDIPASQANGSFDKESFDDSFDK